MVHDQVEIEETPQVREIEEQEEIKEEEIVHVPVISLTREETLELIYHQQILKPLIVYNTKIGEVLITSNYWETNRCINQ